MLLYPAPPSGYYRTLSQSLPLGIAGLSPSPSLSFVCYSNHLPAPPSGNGTIPALSFVFYSNHLPAPPSGRGPFPPFILCVTITIFRPLPQEGDHSRPSFCVLQYPSMPLPLGVLLPFTSLLLFVTASSPPLLMGILSVARF